MSGSKGREYRIKTADDGESGLVYLLHPNGRDLDLIGEVFSIRSNGYIDHGNALPWSGRHMPTGEVFHTVLRVSAYNRIMERHDLL